MPSLAWLSQEALRRKVLAVVAVFIIGLMFAGWFLDPNATTRSVVHRNGIDRYVVDGAAAGAVPELL